MEIKLSAAEIKTLESPQTEQVKQALSLFLKELILLGWVNTRRGKRPIHKGLWLFLLFAIGGFAVHFAIGAVIGFLVLAYWLEARKDQTLLFISPEGEQVLSNATRNSSALTSMLQTVANARPNDMDHCTSKEWRKHLSLYYPNNASFHQEFLVARLVKQGLLEWGPGQQPQRTEAGNAALYKAQTAIQKAHDLPRLLRNNSSNAAMMAAQLSGLVLLIPGIEGYFGQLFQHTGYLDGEMEDLNRRAQESSGATGDGGGSSDGDNRENQDAEDEGSLDNGSDWQDDANFLDGIDADTSDTGIGTDADGGGDGGDSGDGGDGGCSGCGGCGGGD